jgi:hypothetical protein
MLDKDGVLLAPLWITQGEDWDRVFPIADPITGVPIDLTGWTLVGQIRETSDSTVVLYEWKTANTNVAVSVDGKATIQVPSASSLLWSWVKNEAVYDLFLTNLSGKKMCMARGTVVVRPAVTR